ncbi:MAG: phage/plasmid primase, P4 family, partial [Candidatus Micrarchaeia archaeon]
MANPYFELFITNEWAFFPLADGRKTPLGSWEKYLHEKPTPDELEKWRAENYTNFGIVNGKISGGLFALDFEKLEDAMAFFGNKWEETLDRMFVVATPHGGVHVYFISDETLKRRVRIFGEEHPVDLMGEGGYMVAVGSTIVCDTGNCNDGKRGVYKLISKEATLTRWHGVLNFIRKRAAELKWKAALPIEEGQHARIDGILTKEEIDTIAATLEKYWVKGHRNQLTIALAGALIHCAVSRESAKAIILRIGEMKDDSETEEFVKTMEYEWQPHVLHKERLTGLPTLLERMKTIAPHSAETDYAEIIGIIRPQKQTPQELSRRIAYYLTHEFDIITTMDNGEIYIRNDEIYVKDEAMLKQAIQAEFGDEHITRYIIDEAIETVRRMTYKPRSFFDAPPRLIPVKNGVFDILAGTFREYDENDHFIFRLHAKYEPNARAPKFEKFLTEIVYPGDLALLQEMLGYILWRGMPVQKALMLVGEGSNGKSTLLSVIQAVLGSDNFTGIGIQELEENHFLVANLYGKLANIRSELPFRALNDTGVFKHLTGGDPITADVKFGHPFTFVNTAKLIFATNKIPKTPDDSDAFYRRWVIISFPYKFSANPAPSEKQANPNLVSEIIESELPGVLNWLLEGLRRLIKNGWRLSASQTTEEIRLDYIRRSDTVKAFIEDAITVKQGAYTPKNELYDAYVDYCRKNKYQPLGDVAFFKGFERNGIDIHNVSRPVINGKQTRVINNIELKPESSWGKEAEESEAMLTQSSPTEVAPADPQRFPLAVYNNKNVYPLAFKPSDAPLSSHGQPRLDQATTQSAETGKISGVLISMAVPAPAPSAPLAEKVCGSCIFFKERRCAKHPEWVVITEVATDAETCPYFKAAPLKGAEPRPAEPKLTDTYNAINALNPEIRQLGAAFNVLEYADGSMRFRHETGRIFDSLE